MGWLFLSDETTKTFEWLFSSFLKFMKGIEPGVLFSDQCVHKMNSIDNVFSNTKYRLCQWHVNKNAVLHFVRLNSVSAF